MVPWSSGMIPPLQGGDHEFESRRNHFNYFFKILTSISLLSYLFIPIFSKILEQTIEKCSIS